jgi:hypothetical protein
VKSKELINSLVLDKFAWYVFRGNSSIRFHKKIEAQIFNYVFPGVYTYAEGEPRLYKKDENMSDEGLFKKKEENIG